MTAPIDALEPSEPRSLARALLAGAGWMHPARLRRLPPVHREPLAAREARELFRDPIWRLEGAPEGNGHGVALVPGFLAGDGSLGALTDWLRRAGYRTSSAGIRFNIGCSAAILDGLERRVERLADRTGAPVTLIGQSRGGLLGRGLAERRPDLVATLVTLGSPLRDTLAIHPAVLAQIVALGTLNVIGIRGTLGPSCFDGDCCVHFRESFQRHLHDDVRFVSVFSRTDGIVEWRSCLLPGAEHVEVPSTHFGMGMNVHVYRLLADVLRVDRDETVVAPRARAA